MPGLVHDVVGGFTPGSTSFLVMNTDFHFVLAMYVIVCTAGVGSVLRTDVRFEGGNVMAWAGICHDGRTQLIIVQGTFNAVKYRDNILGPIVLSLLH